MIEKGFVVRSKSGRDKMRYYVVIDAFNEYVLIADGNVRKLDDLKRKNIKHVQATNSRINVSEITSDKYLRKLLEPMNQSLLKKHSFDIKEGGN